MVGYITDTKYAFVYVLTRFVFNPTLLLTSVPLLNQDRDNTLTAVKSLFFGL
jgi:hypothetical protein